jgi:hypothetical protein
MTRKAAIAFSARKSESLKQCHKEITTLQALVHRVLRLEMPHVQDARLIRDIKRGLKAAGMPVPSKVQTMRSRPSAPTAQG